MTVFFSFAKLCVLVIPVCMVCQRTAGHSAVQADDLVLKSCLPVAVLASQWPACRVGRKRINTHRKVLDVQKHKNFTANSYSRKSMNYTTAYESKWKVWESIEDHSLNKMYPATKKYPPNKTKYIFQPGKQPSQANHEWSISVSHRESHHIWYIQAQGNGSYNVIVLMESHHWLYKSMFAKEPKLVIHM